MKNLISLTLGYKLIEKIFEEKLIENIYNDLKMLTDSTALILEGKCENYIEITK